MQNYHESDTGKQTSNRNESINLSPGGESAEMDLKELLELKDFPCAPEISAESLRKKQIIVYGAGNGFITLSAFVLNRYRLPVFMILDRKFRKGDFMQEIPCGSLEDFSLGKIDLNRSVVILSMGDRQLRETVKEKLEKLGFPSVISAMDIYEYHLPCLPEGHSKGIDFDFYRREKTKITEALHLFSDNKSREIFAGFLKTHLLRKRYDIPSEPTQEQYFPTEFSREIYRRSICCGAYDGDTAMQISDFCSSVEALACFEPDPQNFELMLQNMKPYHSRIHELLFFPCGVHAQEAQFRFTTNQRMNCAISSDGDVLIQCVALDHALPHFQPTFISIDIEGSEMEALRGCTETIRRCRPHLAVCVYHTPNHIWEIPLFLKRLNADYRFFLRNYSSYSAETVLYAY